MKAKEYAKMFEGLSDEKEIKDKIVEVYKLFIGEIIEISKQRKVGCNSALFGVIREVNQKWNSLVNRCPFLKRDAIIEILKKKHPYLMEEPEIMAGYKFLKNIDY